MSFEDQVKMYQKYLARQPVPAIYIASGNLTSIEMFAKKVAPIPVVDKFSLLSPEDTALLKSMTWDQQDLVAACRFLIDPRDIDNSVFVRHTGDLAP